MSPEYPHAVIDVQFVDLRRYTQPMCLRFRCALTSRRLADFCTEWVMPKRGTDKIGRAGEHYVAAELNRRGAYASPFSGNVPGIDIVATDDDMKRTAYIQVKTKRGHSNWQIGLEHGWAKITPYGCSGDGNCPETCTPSLEEPIPGKPDRFWVFVSLIKNGGQRYYVLTDDEVRRHLVRGLHLDYLEERGGQRPGKKHDSLHHSFKDKDLQGWEDKWEVLGLGDLPAA